MKALCVFSGGLDSILAAEIIRAQDIHVLALFFETPFFSSKKARKSAHAINLPLKVVDITDRHLDVIKNPRHGYGGNMNPCIDCHTLMFKIAGEMLKKEKAHFVVTGEVLGQRPMSQNRQSLTLISAESGLGGLLLRPLSARHLPITTPEEKGWVDRERLMNFHGRSRKPQMELAHQLNIREYPSPAGGCLLTDEVFSRRLKDLLSHHAKVERRQMELLKFGRHFRIGPQTKLIVGRNMAENKEIHALSGDEDLLITASSVPGPTALLSGPISDALLDLAVAITVSYSDAHPESAATVKVMFNNGEKFLTKRSINKDEFKTYML
jgi:tRNA-specific 2-thiouridylase